MARTASRYLAAFFVALAITAMGGRPASAQDSDLRRVGVELARFNKPGALYGYLRDNHPALFGIADKAGLAEACDGKVTVATFMARFERALNQAGLAAEAKNAVASEGQALKGMLGILEAKKNEPREGISAAEAKTKTGADMTKELRGKLYNAENHWMTKLWGADKRGSVGVRFVPGTLLWFNPNVSIPELGIKAGVPLTEDQKKAIVELFSFETVPKNPGAAEGTAAFPEYVGRAVNPNSHAITIINSRGEVISDLVVKGSGPTSPSITRDGRLDVSEAYMDSEVARNLYNAGDKNYDSLVVIAPEGVDGKAIMVRAPRSMLRHLDMDKLNDHELKETLERLARETAIREGKDHMSIAEYASKYLPETSGRNWGVLNGLGVKHGSDTRDNHGMGETVDWGWVEFGERGTSDQMKNEWREVKTTLERINKILPDAEKVNIDEAEKTFNAGFEAGKAHALKEKIKLDPNVLSKLSESDLRTLGRSVKIDGQPDLSYSASREDIMKRLREAGYTRESTSMETLVRAPLAEIKSFAERNGYTVPANADRTALISSITGKSRIEVTRDIARFRRARPAENAGAEHDGLLERLREMVRERTADRDRTRIGR